jgi:hypothetical protein
MDGMTPMKWAAMTVGFAIILAVAAADIRSERRLRKRINEQLRQKACPRCGGTFKPWHGERTRNHYNWAPGIGPSREIRVTCGVCDRAMDAFYWTEAVSYGDGKTVYQQGELRVDPPHVSESEDPVAT